MDKILEITNGLYRETLDEYMASYEEQESKIERFDKRIEEIAAQTKYYEKVKRLGCCKGAVGHKSKDLRARQNGNTADVIAYADKANTRLRS